MSRKLENKVALVTGASKGIGAEIARDLARHGAAVVVNYASAKAAAEKVVADVKNAGGRAVAVQADLSKPDDVTRLFAETKRHFDRLDILVNNAGVYEFAPVTEITPDHFHKQFDLNVLGLLLATKEAVKLFPTTGGAVVNISSVVSTAHFPNAAVYSATKAAVDAATRSLAAELGPRNVRVNAVNPGMVETEGTATVGITHGESDARKQYEAQAPLRRIGKPADVAPLVSFLASDDAAWITAETHFASGGFR